MQQFMGDCPILFILLHMQKVCSVVIIWVVLLLAACDAAQNEAAQQAPLSETAVSQPIAQVNQGTPLFTNVITPVVAATNTPNSLTIWIPAEITARTAAGAELLSDQIIAAGAQYPDIQLLVDGNKPVSGSGGILSYLRSGRAVAPNILPDLMLLPNEQLTAAASEDLIVPLDNLIDPALLDPLYPVALAQARPAQATLGYPVLITNLTHLAYDASVISNTLPLDWTALYANSSHSIILPAPAAGPASATLALQFYLAANGTLVDDNEGAPVFQMQLDPLFFALDQLSLARNSGFILSQSSSTVSFNEAWSRFAANTPPNIVLTTAEQFLQQRDTVPDLGFAPISGPSNPLTPLVDGWSWVITARDPQRRMVAANFMTTLVTAENIGSLSQANGLLPTRRDAFDVWPAGDPYILFLQQELERAQPHPLTNRTTVMTILGDAVFDVLSLTQPSLAAAEEAIQTIQP